MLGTTPLRRPRTRPTEIHHHAMDNLRFIRETMEIASAFTAVPGWAGVAIGVTAMIAAALSFNAPSPETWLLIWIVDALSGEAKPFRRDDLERPVTREFCPNCGTHILTRSPARPGSIILKVGTLDDPSVFTPGAAIFTCDKQAFHHIPEDIPAFDKRPG